MNRTNGNRMEIYKKANEIQLNGVFDENIQDFLVSISNESSSCATFLIPPLLTSVSHLMGMSSVEISSTSFKQGCVLYTALIANPGAGKSPGLTFIKKALHTINTFEDVEEKNSKLVNAPTVEALLFHLNRMKTVLSFFDEAQTFFGSFGRHSNASAANYERSIYLELANAPDIFQRDLKGRTILNNPRLNLCLLGHPGTFIDAINAERSTKNDGLMHRFLLAAPKPPIFFNSNEKRSEKICSLETVFFAIKSFHESPIVYGLTEKATTKFKEYDQEFKEVAGKSFYTDTFVSALFNKSSAILLRLSAILKSLKMSVNFMQILATEKFELNQQLCDEINEFKVRKYDKKTDKISTEIIVNAYNLLEYFNKNKLILAGYSFDVNMPLIASIDKLLMESTTNLQIKSEFKKSNLSDNKLSPEIRKEMLLNSAIKKCLLYPGGSFTVKDLMNKYKTLHKTTIIDAFEFLIENKLGNVVSTTLNGKLTKLGTVTKGDVIVTFVKANLNKLKDDMNLQNVLNSHDITTEEYASSFGDILNESQIEIVKRSATTHDLNIENTKKAELKLVQTPKPTSKENSETEKNNTINTHKPVQSSLKVPNSVIVNSSSNFINKKSPTKSPTKNTPNTKELINQIVSNETKYKNVISKPEFSLPYLKKNNLKKNDSENINQPQKQLKMIVNKENVNKKQHFPIFNITPSTSPSQLISNNNIISNPDKVLNKIPLDIVKNISDSFEKNPDNSTNSLKLKLKKSESNVTQNEAQIVNNCLKTEKFCKSVLCQYTQTSLDLNASLQEKSTQTEEMKTFNPLTLRHLASSSMTPLLLNPLLLNQLKHYINLIQLIVNNNQKC